MAKTKRVTSRDIAKLAGVSRTTVSFVLNDVAGMNIPDKTRQRVLEAARQLNYRPNAAAQTMKLGRTNTIGFVMRQSDEQVFSDQFLPAVLHGLADAIHSQNYRILFTPIAPEYSGDVYLNLIREQRVDGIILSGPRSDDEDLLRLSEDG